MPGALRPTVLVDVTLRMVGDLAKALEHNQPVDFYCGAAEVEARTRLLGGKPGPRRDGLGTAAAGEPGRRGTRRSLYSAPGLAQPYAWRRQGGQPLSWPALASISPGSALDVARTGKRRSPGDLRASLRREEPATYSQVLATSSLDRHRRLMPSFSSCARTTSWCSTRTGLPRLPSMRNPEASPGLPSAGNWGESILSAADKQRVAALPVNAAPPKTWAELQQRMQVILAGFQRQTRPCVPALPPRGAKEPVAGEATDVVAAFLQRLGR